MLADKVEIGDYVNYPVYYDNVNGSTLKGWRVISKNIDLDGNPSPGTVNLVSAGEPLTYYQNNGTALKSVEKLNNDFLAIPFSSTERDVFRKNGFSPFLTLHEVFDNKYTVIESGSPKVRSMNFEDISRVTKNAIASGQYVGNGKYNKLFANGGDHYWIAYTECADGLNFVRANWLGDVSYMGYYLELGIRPVTSLKSDLKTSGMDLEDIWQLEM